MSPPTIDIDLAMVDEEPTNAVAGAGDILTGLDEITGSPPDATGALAERIANAITTGQTLYIPHGIYTLTAPLIISVPADRSLRLTGDFPILRAACGVEPFQAVLYIIAAGPLSVERLVLDCNGVADHGLRITQSAAPGSRFAQIIVRNARRHAFDLWRARNALFQSCAALGALGDGWRIAACGGTRFDMCSAHGAVNGFAVTGFGDACSPRGGSCTLTCVDAEVNNQHGIALMGGEQVDADTPDVPRFGGVVVRDGWLESNQEDGVRVGTWGAVLSGLRIVLPPRAGTRAIRLLQHALWADIQGNWLLPPGEAATANAILQAASSVSRETIRGNFRMSNTVAGWGFARVYTSATAPAAAGHTVEPPDYTGAAAEGAASETGACWVDEDFIVYPSSVSGPDGVLCTPPSNKGVDHTITGLEQALAGYVAVTDPSYGADPTGVKDSTAAIQSALDNAGSGVTTKIGAVYIPRGVYRVSESLTLNPTLHHALRIISDGGVLRVDPEADPLDAVLRLGETIDASNPSGSDGTLLTVQGLTIDANGVATHGLELNRAALIGSVVERVRVQGARSHGIVVTECQGMSFRDCIATLCGGDGWRVRGCNGSQLNACRAEWNNANGFTLTSFAYPPGSGRAGGTGQCFLIGATALGNGRDGVALLRDAAHLVDSQTPSTAKVLDGTPSGYSSPAEQAAFGTNAIVVRDCWIVGNHCDGIRVGIWYALLDGNRISPALAGPTPVEVASVLQTADATPADRRAIRILPDTYWTTVVGNRAHTGSSGGAYASVQLDVGSVDFTAGEGFDPQPNRNRFYVQGNFRIDDNDAPVGDGLTGFMPVLGAEPVDMVGLHAECPITYAGGWVAATPTSP